MRIGFIAPPWTPVPPRFYGGIEKVVELLAVGCQARGHEVLLFTTGDSTCDVPRRSVLPQAEGGRIGHVVPELRHVMHGYQAVRGFDVVHDHTILGPVYAERFPDARVVTTVHGPFDADLTDVYGSIAQRVAIVAVSRSQAASAPSVPVAATIHHGLDAAAFPYRPWKGPYCLFLGRMDPDKGAHRAIEAARQAGRRLILAGKMRSEQEREYFRTRVEPQLGGTITYVGEVDDARKLDLLAGARCLLFPIRWPEPFGLVMLEALACGTPVIAFAEGAVPEVVANGRTGLLCRDEAEMAAAIDAIDEIEPAACREAVEGHFAAERMVSNHLDLYEEVMRGASNRQSPSTEPAGV
jgi:glycosyltransferase involved in cell wall biosynthesis